MRPYGTQLRPRQQQQLAYSGVATLITDMTGQIAGPADGYFLEDTRLLSRAAGHVDGRAPAVFSAGRAGSTRIVVHGQARGDGDLLEDALFVELSWSLGPELRLRVQLTNHAPHRRRPFELSLELAADYADLHETI